MTDARHRVADRVVESCDEPDYSAVELPAKPPTEYSYTQRRAELLQLIADAGHPAALNQTELADRYGVSQQQISKDFDRIAQHVHARLADRDRRALLVDSTVSRAIEGLLADDEYRKAARTALEYDEWAIERVELDALHAKVDRLEGDLGGPPVGDTDADMAAGRGLRSDGSGEGRGE
jgi:transcriptional antiterminator